MTMKYTQSLFSSPITSTITLSSPWGVTPICPSILYQPIRGQYWGHVIILDQSAAAGSAWAAAWHWPAGNGLSLWDHVAMNGAICLLLPAAHLSRQLRLNIMRESRACHNIGNISSSLSSLSWSPGHIYTLIIMWTLVHTALNRILHSWEITARDKIIMSWGPTGKRH